MKLYGTPQPWYGGYKYYGEGGYVIYLKMRYNACPPVKLPNEITMVELEQVRPLFDVVEECPRGGLSV